MGETHSLLSLVNKRGPITNSDGEIVGMNTEEEQVSAPKLPEDPLPYDPSSSIILQETELRFTRAGDSKYLNFELDKSVDKGYSAAIRLGSTANPSNFAVTRFMLRDAQSATKFINQLVTTCKKEGYVPIGKP